MTTDTDPTTIEEAKQFCLGQFERFGENRKSFSTHFFAHRPRGLKKHDSIFRASERKLYNLVIRALKQLDSEGVIDGYVCRGRQQWLLLTDEIKAERAVQKAKRIAREDAVKELQRLGVPGRIGYAMAWQVNPITLVSWVKENIK